MANTPASSSRWSGYTRATIEQYERHRLIGCSFGEAGSRKTSFWLEGPAPVVVFSLDQGLESVVSRVLREQKNKEIYVKEYAWYPTKDEDLREMASEIVDSFTRDYTDAIQHARTVILDKETQWWQIFQYAEWGSAKAEMRDYDKVNARMRRVINMAKATDVNLGLIDDMRDVWGEILKGNGKIGRGPTGDRERHGFKELDGLVHVMLHHEGLSPDDWAMTVGKVRGPGSPTIAGKRLPSLSFSEFAMMVFPDSTEDEWT